MNTPKYLIAKYIPDLLRVEPRNIGVVLWTPDGVMARFIGEKSDLLGDVDGRRVPGYINSTSAYKQWIDFWRTEMTKGELFLRRIDATIQRADQQFIQALAETSKGNYVLVDGGGLLDTIDAQQAPQALAYLYNLLVEAGEAVEVRDPTLDELCEQLLHKAQLANHPYFKSRHAVECEIVSGVNETFEFSYAFGNGSLQRLYQRVPIAKQKKKRKEAIDASAWKFEKVANARIVSQNDVVALVRVSDEQKSEPDIRDGLDVLSSVARVINITNTDEALNEFSSLAAMP